MTEASSPASPASMIERVARAIGVPEQSGLVCWWSLEAARAAIEAMREPTDEMAMAAGSDWGAALDAQWKAMIDGALK